MGLFLFNEIIVKKQFIPNNFFLVIYIVGCLTLALSIAFFIKSWYGYKYKMIPNSIAMENYYGQIREHYEGIDEDNHDDWTNEAFQEYLLSSFRDYSAYNTVNNDRKSYNLHRSISALLMSFFLFVIPYYPYYIFIHQQS
jgi:hypothetical protein